MRIMEVRQGTKLDQVLKVAEICDSGGAAKRDIQAGIIKVNGAVEFKRGYRVKDGDIIKTTKDILLIRIIG